MRGRPHIVYLSFEGLLAGRSGARIVEAVTELAAGGDYRLTICSLESGSSARIDERRRRLEADLRARHIRWRPARRADGDGTVGRARSLGAFVETVDGVVEADGADLLWARGPAAAAVARRIGDRYRIPYLFEATGPGLDERLGVDRGPAGVAGGRLARMVEEGVWREADGVAVVSPRGLLEADDGAEGRPTEVVSAAVDYRRFVPASGPEASVDIEAVGFRAGDGPVLGLIDEMTDREASIRIFDHVLDQHPDAHLIGLADRPEELVEALQRRSLPPASYSVEAVDRDSRADWLAHIQWGLMVDDVDRGRVSAPVAATLGEFFAAGVRPVYVGSSSQIRRWVDEAGSGHLVERADEEGLRQAASAIAETTPMPHDVWGARWRTRSQFGLQQAVDGYDRLCRRVVDGAGSRRLKVLFLTEGTTVPASRFRVQQLIPHLEDRGIDCTVRQAYGDDYNRWSSTVAGPVYKLACSLRRIPWALDGDRFDVVFLQRPALPFTAVAERLANWRNPKTIFDVDDAIFVGPDGSERPRQKEAFEAIVDRCAHVICGNEYLADKTRHRTPTTVIPTVVDTDVYRPTAGDDGDGDGDEVVVGWMGTASNFESLASIAPLLGRLAAEIEKCSVTVVSNRRFEPLADLEGVDQIRWSADREVELLDSFDIGVMPLIDNEVTRGKCGFKAIQYMACATPVVASPVGVNRPMLEGTSAGMLAEGPDEFESALRELIGDSGRRRRMGRAGRRLVQQHYSVDSVIDRYVELFETVARRRPARPVEAGPSMSATQSPRPGG